MSVAIIGTVAFDSVETPSAKHEKILGGAATFAATAATIFSPAAIISIIGKDFPEKYLQQLSSRNINLEGIKIAEGKTFHWQGYYKADMNQAFTINTELNTLLEFDPIVPDSVKNYPIVFCANIDPVLQAKFIRQFTNPKLIILDTMNYWITNKLDELKETLKLVDVLIINDQETRMLTGIDNIIKAMPEIIKMGPKRLIVKKGEHGAIMFNGKDYFLLPAFPLSNLVDPTGAGDSFAGGFCGYLASATELNEDTYKKAILAGTITASFTVQDFSTASLNILNKNKINQKYNEFKNYISIPEKII